MDHAIATEVMGWPARSKSPLSGIVIHSVPGDTYRETGGSEYSAFDPSTDMAHAWEVVEKIGDLNLEHLPSGKWLADFRGFAAEADTAPLAICRAALMALKPEGE